MKWADTKERRNQEWKRLIRHQTRTKEIRMRRTNRNEDFLVFDEEDLKRVLLKTLKVCGDLRIDEMRKCQW